MTKFIELGDGKDYFAIVRRADYYREGGKYLSLIHISTSTIKLLIAKMSLLSAYIAEKDKEPLWDGQIGRASCRERV